MGCCHCIQVAGSSWLGTAPATRQNKIDKLPIGVNSGKLLLCFTCSTDCKDPCPAMSRVEVTLQRTLHLMMPLVQDSSHFDKSCRFQRCSHYFLPGSRTPVANPTKEAHLQRDDRGNKLIGCQRIQLAFIGFGVICFGWPRVEVEVQGIIASADIFNLYLNIVE